MLLFFFDRVSPQLLTPPDWPQIFWQVPQAFSTCISSRVMYFNCVLVVEIFYRRLGLCCLWRFFSFFFLNRAWPVVTVLMLYKPKRREADSCKYTCTHSCRTLIWFLKKIHNQGITVLISQKQRGSQFHLCIFESHLDN